MSYKLHLFVHSLDRNEGGTHNFPGKRHLLSFLSWLDYIDQLIRESHQVRICSGCVNFDLNFIFNISKS